MLAGELFVRMALDSKQYEKDLGRMEGVTQKKAMTLGSIFKGAFSFALGIGLLQGFRSLGGAITDFVNTAARTEVLDIAMQSVAKSSGYAITALREQRKSVMELGIAEQEATQILTRFMQAQLDTADAARLARVAQDAAVIAGYNSSQAAEQMTEAIAKQRPELLSAFGMTRNMNEIYKDYAKTVGKTTKQLTEAEKKQAMLNYILAEGEKIAGTYEASMGVVGKQISSLPRYWDTLKNAIAKPLALPALSVIVDGITNSLKKAISWAEVNKVTLQSWGKAVANTVKTVLTWVTRFTAAMAQNWSWIKTVVAMLITYSISLKTAAIMTEMLRLITLSLKGELVAIGDIFAFLSKVVGIYQVQMALAAMQGIAMTGVLAKLKVAIYSVLAAIPGLGWVVLALTAIVGGGIALWNRYTKTLEKPVAVADIAKQMDAVFTSTEGAADAAKDQADALKKAGKAARDNIQSFDEVHQLQEDMSLDTPTLDDFTLPEIPDMAEMLAGFETELPSFGERVKGFFGWLWDGIKNSAVTAWNWITGTLKNIWEGFVSLTRPIWEPIAGILSPLWQSIVTTATTIWGVLGPFFSTLWDGIKSVAETIWKLIVFSLAFIWFSIVEIAKTIWSVLGPFFSLLWEGIKTVTMAIWNGLAAFFTAVWNTIVTAATAIWSVLDPFFSTLWEGIKKAALVVWNFLAPFLKAVWDGLLKAASIWKSIGRAVEDPVEAARKAVETISNKIKTTIGAVWNAILKKFTDMKDMLYNRIVEPWEAAKETVLGIVKEAMSWGKNLIQNIIDGIKSKFSSLKSAVSEGVDIVKGFLGFSSPTEKGPGRYADKWAPNLIKMFAEGISGGVPEIRSAVSDITKQLTSFVQPMVQQPVTLTHSAATTSIVDSASIADTVAQAVYRAVMDAIRISQASQQADDRDLVLKIDSTVLARLQLPAIIKEGKRQGLNFVVRPQGT